MPTMKLKPVIDERGLDTNRANFFSATLRFLRAKEKKFGIGG